MVVGDAERLAGQLLVVGFDGTSAPAELVREISSGAIGGVVLFKRNVSDDLAQVAELNASLARAASPDMPLLISIDQEGGRVRRLRAGVAQIPAMLELRSIDTAALTEIAEVVSEELLALGFTMSFAPVLDVHSNEHNPIIGDRAFGTDAEMVSVRALAYADGMRRAGLLCCGKHFPGHGDTSQDSHLELPIVLHSDARLRAVELVPFAAAARAQLDALMTAHVVYPAWDDEPATLSRKISHELLRTELRFDGVLFSDDLEMKALSSRMTYAESAVRAVRAGCDALLVCSKESAWREAREAIARRIEQDSEFRERCDAAHDRFVRMRRRCPPRTPDLARIGTERGDRALRLARGES